MKIFKVTTEWRDSENYDSKNVSAKTCEDAIKKYKRTWDMMRGERISSVQLVASED